MQEIPNALNSFFYEHMKYICAQLVLLSKLHCPKIHAAILFDVHVAKQQKSLEIPNDERARTFDFQLM